MSSLYLLRFQNQENKTWFKVGRSDDVDKRARSVTGALGLPTKILCTIPNGGTHETSMVKGMREVYGAVPTAGRELFATTCTNGSVCKTFKRYYGRVIRAHARTAVRAKAKTRQGFCTPIRKASRLNLRRSGTVTRPAWRR
jgi:hypothetical protein